jgi:hypothetical protein
MNRSPRRVLAVAAATAALVGSQLLAGAASAAPASGLQQEVDAYLAEHPDARQISENRVAIDGGAVTLATPGQAEPRQACDYGHLCIVDGDGDFYDYYYCGTYEFWGVGWGTYNNNQSAGTTAYFYDSAGNYSWESTAPDSGSADWTPVFYISPC